MRFATLARWTLVCAAQALAACDHASAPDALSNAIKTAHPFASKFTSYETWALRATSVSGPSAGYAALNEALFAPLRNDGAVLAAWIKLRDRAGDELAFPPNAIKPDARDWAQVRHPRVGWILVFRYASCPIALPKGWRSGPVGCVLMTRDPDHQRSSGPIITMAFVDTSS